ncbi:tryptophan--tRNA ligase [Candidatus Dependentiae bacterium]|nr:tryptophan--tRNA ligase [Candidatus Dependentiae bacterium]
MRVVSGIQPTGVAHLGNYFGAFANWIELQNAGHECFYFIANQHAITIPQNNEILKKNTLEITAIMLAVGLDPKKSTIFIQSDIPVHTQLSWILSCLSPIGEMERMVQFKEKSKIDPSATNLGLLSYPTLQAADILIYKADLVPVGIDQAQHLELTRLLARKFNNTYKSIFKEPKTLHTKTTKVVGLDGAAKMSKGLNNYIGLVEDEKTIWKKLSVAMTDPARKRKTDPGNPAICNIYILHKLFSSQKDLDWVVDGCTNAKIGCIECKKKLFENIIKLTNPIREKYLKLINNPNDLKDILSIGAKKATIIAQQTMDEVNALVGFKYF